MSLSVDDSGAGLALPYYDRSSALRATFHHSNRRTNATAAAANASLTNASRARAKAQLMPLPPPSPPSAVSLMFVVLTCPWHPDTAKSLNCQRKLGEKTLPHV